MNRNKITQIYTPEKYNRERRVTEKGSGKITLEIEREKYTNFLLIKKILQQKKLKQRRKTMKIYNCRDSKLRLI